MNELKMKLQQEENFMEVYKTAFLKLQVAIKKEDLKSFADLIIELSNGLSVPVPGEVAKAFNNKDVGIARSFLLDLMTKD